VFFLRKPKRNAPAPVEPMPLAPDPEPEPEPTYQPLALAPRYDEPPDGLPGVPDLYAIIGVDPLSSDEIIRYAYRKKAARLHERRWRPDQAVRQLAELNAAYEILGKPDRRADYDRRRARAAMFERTMNGSAADGAARAHGRGLPSGQRHGARRLRLGRPAGFIEVVVIVAVVALALYAATTVLDTRSLVDLSKVVELGETLGVAPKRRATPAPAPTAAPTPAASASIASVAGGGPLGAEPTPQPTAAPTAPPPPPTAAPASAKPASRMEGSTVRVSSPSPARRSDVSVTARILRDGRPFGGAQVHLVAHFKTVDERWPAGSASQPTGANGEATITFNIGDATPGHQVNVDVVGLVEGEPVQLQTSFTPR
jgi:hypothetical protein